MKTSTNKAQKPRRGKVMEKRSFSLHPDQWARLKQIEQETGVRPSATVQRMLDKTIGRVTSPTN